MEKISVGSSSSGTSTYDASACHSQWPVSQVMPPPKLQWLGPPGTITASSFASRILSRSAA